MYAWIRTFDPMQSENAEPWHLVGNSTVSGMTVVQCGDTFLPGDSIEQRSFSDSPALLDRCDSCQLVGKRNGAVPVGVR